MTEPIIGKYVKKSGYPWHIAVESWFDRTILAGCNGAQLAVRDRMTDPWPEDVSFATDLPPGEPACGKCFPGPSRKALQAEIERLRELLRQLGRYPEPGGIA